ncbi:MAG: folate family ECF transporter S component [Clostridium sp.]|uniref:folate family ECF transporter S component n=1 Tax=Negativibacillus massiliensis TaxID=1871035 RepID=UPI0023F73164|nr:folate family ECF transporter S component [Negativibacillus massiliensis]MBS5138469.1 folate family ECF transporter S component [Clostridium sp.]
MNLVPKQAENSLSLSTTKQVENSLSLPEKFRQSAQELKQVRTLTGVAMLLAMSVVISFTASVRVTETIKIGLGYLITALLGMLYGPFTAALAAGAGDLIKYLLKPDGAYFFGFTLTAMLGGVVYGVFFYREKCTIPRAIASKATVSLLLNCLLNTVWVSWLYGMPFLGALGPRVIKNLMALPFEIVLLYIVLNGMNKVIQRAKLH